MSRGALNFDATDLIVPGPVPITLTRHYDSTMAYTGPLGNNTDCSLNRSVGTDPNTGAFYYHTGQGYKIQIGQVSNGSLTISNSYRDHYTFSLNSYNGLTITDIHGNQDFMDAKGFIVKSLDKNGNELDFTRDASERLLKVMDPVHGTYISFTVNTSTNLITAATDSFGRTVSYSYDANNNLTEVTSPATSQFPTGTTFQYTYDAYDRLLTEVDGKGNTILSNVWGTVARVYWEMDPGSPTGFDPVYADRNGNPVTSNRVLANEVASQMYNGHTITYNYTYYDGYKSNIPIIYISAVDVRGYTTDYYNDGNGDITKVIVHTAGLHPGAPATYETDYTYDVTGKTYNKLTETDPSGSRMAWTYDANSNVLTTTKSFPSGATVNSSEGTQYTTATTTYTYEPRFNQVASVQDANGNTTTYNYGTAGSNPGGNLLSITYPTTAAGTATENFTYNSLGQMLTDTAPDGTVTQNTYNAATGYLTQTIKDYSTSAGHLNATTQFSYDSYGHVAGVTDPDGHTVTTTTNAQNQVTEIDGASGEVEQRSYDENGNLTVDQKQAPGSQWEKTVNVYNAYQQLSATQQYTSASSYLETDYGYDNDGNRTSVTDPLSHTATIAYDERGKAYLFTDALGHTVQYDFDGDGNTVKLTDELSHATTYAFDGLDRMEQKNFPDGSYQTWKYDAAGNITSLRTTAGNTIGQTYDQRNRMLTQSYTAAGGPSTITNVYDILGRVLTTTEGGTALTYVYDRLGRNTSFTDQAGHVSTYTYDLAGNRTSTTYPTSVTVNRAHDSSNRVTTLKDGSGNTQATYSYDILDRATGVTLANSTSTSYGYDLLNRLSSVTNTLGGTTTRNYSYVYDNASRVTSTSDPRGTITSGYSNRNEVTGITEPTGSPFAGQSFTYDAGFNRSNWTQGSTSVDYTVNNLDQYATVSGSTAPVWNTDGGLSTFGGNSYTYDALGRLTQVSNSVGIYVFSYDPLGRRVKKVDENPSGAVLATTSYHYDGSEVAVEYQPSTTYTYYLGLGIDQVVMRTDGTNKQWYYRDGHGSVSAIADNSGNVLEQYEYNAQGQFQITNGSGTVQTVTQIGNTLMYTGRNYDAETGNYFYRARYYNPTLGRFISRDPLSGAEFSQGTNLYAYCRNNFLNANDPTGMCKFNLNGDPSDYGNLTNPLERTIYGTMSVDTDGTGPNIWNDSDYQGHVSSGANLDANLDSYGVVPNNMNAANPGLGGNVGLGDSVTYTNLENGNSVSTTVQDSGNTFPGNGSVEASVATDEGLGATINDHSWGPDPTMNGSAESPIPVKATFVPGSGAPNPMNGVIP